MCDFPRYEICACDESLALLDALERAWAEIPLGAARADVILRNALDRHHTLTIEAFRNTVTKGNK